ncbi:MAG: redoxin domain-containing protein [Flavobacteriales bacterium]
MSALNYCWSLLFFLMSCGIPNQNQIVDGEHIDLEHSNQLTVLLFMDPECPLCENYTLNFNKLSSSYPKLKVYAVFSGADLYTKQQLIDFKSRYKLNMTFVWDKSFELAKAYQAKVTPEVVLISETGEVLYQGKVDNWLEKLGRRRKTVSQFYLNQAIESHLKGDSVQTKRTQAIGCLIQYPHDK